MKTQFILAFALALSACTSLQPIPLASVTAPACAKDGSPRAEELCAVLAGPTDSARIYRARYEAIGFERLVLDGTLITAAIAGAGFGLFGAHPDNVTAAALTTGAVGVLRGGLKQTEQLKVLRNGYGAMNCFLTEGSAMTGIYNNGKISQAEILRLRSLVQDAIVAGTRAPAPKTPDEMAQAVQLSALLTRARELVETSEQASNAYGDFTQNLAKSYNDATANIESRTEGLDINAATLAQRITEAATEIAKKSAPPTPTPDAISTGSATIQQAIDDLVNTMSLLQQMEPARIVKAYNGLAVCLARSAA